MPSDNANGDDEQFVCEQCGKGFKFERVYTKHQFSCDGSRTVTNGDDDPDPVQPCAVTEYYEAFRSLKDVIKRVDPSVESADTPQAQYWKVITSIISQGHPDDETIPGYGGQQADRVSHSTDDYREAYGTDDWITDYQTIDTAGPEAACVERLSEDLSEIPIEIHRPIPPTADSPLPIIVDSDTELIEALNLLGMLPAKPARTDDENPTPQRLPIKEIYEALFAESDIDTVAFEAYDCGQPAHATPPSADEWDIETLTAATELDRGIIRDGIEQLKTDGCTHAVAVEWYRRYLADMLRGEGLFALHGVGPSSGRELFHNDLKSVEDVKTATPESVASGSGLSVTRVEAIREAALAEKFDSYDPEDAKLASILSDPEGATGDNPGTNGTGGGTSSGRSSPDNKIITRKQAADLLQQSVGTEADFRPQQWQAIDKLANKKQQLLLVQRTGWGKSTVYFIATHALREQGAGPTLIISPLLSLMRDQIKNAEQELGLDAVTINSRNEDNWNQIYADIQNGNCDLVLISPERLKNQDFRDNVLSEMYDGFGMLVVDEAHCISDWGHDFRPDYQRVTRLLEGLPSDVPVAATTATANDRVVDDITNQLPGLEPMRGNLVRDSLKIQAIKMGSREKRLAWLAENLPQGQQAGIVYCLTVDDVNRVSEWLRKHEYDVRAYHGGLGTEKRQKREQLLIDNEVDALVATNALGMGFDKPDLRYVIHFQRPQNLIRYYQEIGRAGRDLDTAHAVVLSGPDDDDTAEFFIETAFPSASDFKATLDAIDNADEPLSAYDIRKESDGSNVQRCLKILNVEGVLRKGDDGYVRTGSEWHYTGDKFDEITSQRYDELERIQRFMETDRCLTLYIDNQLDGELTDPCGRCANCAGDFYPRSIHNEELVDQAVDHYQQSGIETINNRVYRYDEDGNRTKIPEEYQLETGRNLSILEDPGWGSAVKEGKFGTGQFDQTLVTAAAELIQTEWDPTPAPEWITFVPSASNEGLIEDLAQRLGSKLELEVIDCIQRVKNIEQQRKLNSSFDKSENVRNAYEVTNEALSGPVLLVDDIVASRWTFTEVGIRLGQAGADCVYPFALARRRE